MKNNLDARIQTLNINDAPPRESYLLLSKKIDFEIDQDFLDFIKRYDGAEGFLNSNEYILLWGINDLIALNPYYEDNEKSLRLFFFATDGSNFGYAFSKENGKVVGIDFLDLYDKEPTILAESFESFLMNTEKL